jgi:hypothetical protein
MAEGMEAIPTLYACNGLFSQNFNANRKFSAIYPVRQILPDIEQKFVALYIINFAPKCCASA